MNCPNCNAEIQGQWKVCPQCTRPLAQKPVCAACEKDLEPAWQACPFCGATAGEPEADAAATIRGADIVADTIDQKSGGDGAVDLEDAVVEKVAQEADGAAALTAEDAVIGSVEQRAGKPEGQALAHAANEKVGQTASMNLTDVVAGEIHQTVHNVYHLGLTPGDVDALEMIQNLRQASGLKARLVFAACGRKIMAYAPHGHTAGPASVYALPDSMGSARSIRLIKADDKPMMLAGARGGVVVFDLASGDAKQYEFPEPTNCGVNASTVHEEFLYATHSDLGLLRWPIEGGPPERLFHDVFGAAKTVRSILVDLAGHLILCADTRVYRIDLAQPDRSPAVYQAPASAKELVGVVEFDSHIYAASLDGFVLRWRVGIPGPPDVLRALGTKTYSLSLAQLPAGPRLVVGSKAEHVCLINVHPPHAVADYRAADGTLLRWARAAPDLVVGTDSAGGQLLFWQPNSPHRPQREITVGHSPRERVMDICILSC